MQVCRPSKGLCDAAEYCTGDSGDCPEDKYASHDTVGGLSCMRVLCMPKYRHAASTFLRHDDGIRCTRHSP